MHKIENIINYTKINILRYYAENLNSHIYAHIDIFFN